MRWGDVCRLFLLWSVSLDQFFLNTKMAKNYQKWLNNFQIFFFRSLSSPTKPFLLRHLAFSYSYNPRHIRRSLRRSQFPLAFIPVRHSISNHTSIISTYASKNRHRKKHRPTILSLHKFYKHNACPNNSMLPRWWYIRYSKISKLAWTMVFNFLLLSRLLGLRIHL